VLESQKGIQLAVEPAAQVDRAPTLAQPQQQRDVTSKSNKHMKTQDLSPGSNVPTPRC
jgi:hypothetical protein